MKTIKIICILFLSSFSLFSQSPAHQKGDSLYQYTNDMPAAIANYQTALHQYQVSEDFFNVELVAIGISRSLYNMGLYDSVRHFLSPMSFIHNDNIFAKNRVLGDVAFAISSDYHGAIAYYHKSRKLLPLVESVSTDQRINLLFYLAEAHNSLWQYDSARHYLALSLAEARHESADRALHEAKYYYSVAKTFIYQQIPDSVKYYLARSESVFKKANKQHRDYYYHLSHLHDISAYFYDRIGYRDSVLYHADKEIEYLKLDPQTSKISLAEAYVNAANDRINEGLFNQASQYLEDALKLYKPLVNKGHRNLAYAYMIKGRLLAAQPQALNEALTFFLQSIHILNDIYSENHPMMFESKYYTADVLYRLGQYDKSLQYYEDALGIARASNDPRSLMQSHLGMGKLLTAIDRYDKAREHLETGWDILQSARGKLDFINASFAMAMAELHLKTDDHSQATEYYYQALEVYKSNVGDIHPEIAHTYLRLAKLALEKEDFSKALNLLTQSDKANRLPDFDSEDLALANFGTSIEINTTKAKVLMAQFDINQDPGLLTQSKNLYLKNSQILFELLLSERREDDLEYYSGLHNETFKGAIAVVRKELSLEPSDELRKELFMLSEKSRAVLLRLKQLKALNTNNSARGLPASQEISKKQELINYYKSLYNATTPAAKVKRNQYRSTLFNLNLELTELKTNTLSPYPDNIHTSEDLDLRSIQKELKPEQTVIEYTIQNDHLLIFLLDKDSFMYREISLTEEFETNVVSFKTALKNERFETFKTISSQLYKTLIAPVKDQIKNPRLIIIPDQHLWNVHFDLLTDSDKNKGEGFKGQHFLLKDYAISYANSLSDLIQSQREKRTPLYNLLALAYDEEVTGTPQLRVMRNKKLTDLPGTAQEILNLNNIVDGDYLFGQKANEHAFKNKASDFRVLHLAIHAEVDSLNDELTKMYFIRDEKDTLEDGLLYSYEIYSMRFNAELAVLSACNTGSGRLNIGEGIMSLGRAFQYAGVNSLVLSQWEVSDASTPEIMESFYANLKQKMPKDEALRQAKLSFLDNANNVSANPLYWGSFFILGSPDPIDLGNKSFVSRNWLLIILLVVIATYMAIRVRKRSRVSP